MFARAYYALRYFAARYFPQSQGEAPESVTPPTRAAALDFAHRRTEALDFAHARTRTLDY